ncbi:MAG: response regulator transcription factor [Pyrinomonadaceae bacterium]
MIRVLIADDHTIVRHGLRQVLEAETDIRITGEAQNGNEVLEILRASKVDVAVLDITMPGRNGLETLKEIKQLYPNVAAIVLSMHPKDQYAVRVVMAGAAGYITKESAPEELVGAIRKAYRGERYISPDVAELLADHVEHGASQVLHQMLSDREFETFRLLASGQSITQIADDLNLSVKTVSTYKSRIGEKTGLSSIADITRYALEHDLI